MKMPGADGVWELWSLKRVSRFLTAISKTSMWGVLVLQPVLEKIPKNRKLTASALTILPVTFGMKYSHRVIVTDPKNGNKMADAIQA